MARCAVTRAERTCQPGACVWAARARRQQLRRGRLSSFPCWCPATAPQQPSTACPFPHRRCSRQALQAAPHGPRLLQPRGRGHAPPPGGTGHGWTPRCRPRATRGLPACAHRRGCACACWLQAPRVLDTLWRKASGRGVWALCGARGACPVLGCASGGRGRGGLCCVRRGAAHGGRGAPGPPAAALCGLASAARCGGRCRAGAPAACGRTARLALYVPERSPSTTRSAKLWLRPNLHMKHAACQTHAINAHPARRSDM